MNTLATLVPGPASEGVACLPANNNDDLCRFGGRLYLVWRTSPNHFASGEARLEVASASATDGPWRHEATIALGTDVREPRFVADDGRLLLFFMELGTDPKRFQPRGVLRMETHGGGTWTEPARTFAADSVPWRIRRLQGRWAMVGYRGGEQLYGLRPKDPVVEVRWSDDLEQWTDPVDIHAGGTECELIDLPDGRLLGITRNEGPTRRGADVLVGTSVEELVPHPVPRKLDSPNLFLWDGEPWLIARRQVANGGRYDLVPGWTPGALAMRLDQAVWSLTRKRSALYRVDPDAGTVTWELDLPSRGDTSFAAVVPEPDGSLLVADYSSPAGGGDVRWIQGQLRGTEITLHRLHR